MGFAPVNYSMIFDNINTYTEKHVAKEQGTVFEKIPHFHLHTLRYTFAARCFEDTTKTP